MQYCRPAVAGIASFLDYVRLRRSAKLGSGEVPSEALSVRNCGGDADASFHSGLLTPLLGLSRGKGYVCDVWSQAACDRQGF